MAAFSFPTKVASRTPSSYGWKSANQAGPCCKECHGNDPHSHPGRLSKRVAGDGRLVAARGTLRDHRVQRPFVRFRSNRGATAALRRDLRYARAHPAATVSHRAVAATEADRIDRSSERIY